MLARAVTHALVGLDPRRVEVEAHLQRGVPAFAIVGLADEWEDITSREEQLGYHYSPNCTDICYLAQQAERGDVFRIFRRRASLRR